MKCLRSCCALFTAIVLAACSAADGMTASALPIDPEAMLDGGNPLAVSWDPCEQFPGLCSDRVVEVPTIEETVVVVPGDGLPAEVTTQMSNNNLDAIFFDQRLWLAFRTASHHHPRADAEIYVLSTDDLLTWRFEHHMHTGEDLREPQLAIVDGALLVYYSAVEPTRTNFRPIGVRVSRRDPVTGDWSREGNTMTDGLLVWRINPQPDGSLTSTGYGGLGGVFNTGEVAIWWQRSTDGLLWEPVVGDDPAVFQDGCSESDIVHLDDGSIIAVARNDFGDADGHYGTKICRAPAEDLGAWTCSDDPRKFDSPRLFRHGDRIYLVGRRNLTADGAYDIGGILPDGAARLAYYMAVYWNRPKRCALWEVDPETLVVEHRLDLPSKGDTCFPEVLPIGDDQVMIWNYTSPLGGDDEPTWRQGQNAPTQITYSVVTLP